MSNARTRADDNTLLPLAAPVAAPPPAQAAPVAAPPAAPTAAPPAAPPRTPTASDKALELATIACETARAAGVDVEIAPWPFLDLAVGTPGGSRETMTTVRCVGVMFAPNYVWALLPDGTSRALKFDPATRRVLLRLRGAARDATKCVGLILQALIYDRVMADRVARNARITLLAPTTDLVILESEASPLRYPALPDGNVPTALLSQTLEAWARTSTRPPKGKGTPKAPTTGPTRADTAPAGQKPAGQKPASQVPAVRANGTAAPVAPRARAPWHEPDRSALVGPPQGPAGPDQTTGAQAAPATNGTAAAPHRTAKAPPHGKPIPLRRRLESSRRGR